MKIPPADNDMYEKSIKLLGNDLSKRDQEIYRIGFVDGAKFLKEEFVRHLQGLEISPGEETSKS